MTSSLSIIKCASILSRKKGTVACQRKWANHQKINMYASTKGERVSDASHHMGHEQCEMQKTYTRFGFKISIK